MTLVLPLLGLVAPFILWPIELVFPVPALVEELSKGFLVYLGRDLGKKQRVWTSLFIGIAFALTESVLFVFNILAVGGVETLVTRLALTTPLHAGTALLMTVASFKGKWAGLSGLLLAIVIHAVFNYAVSS